MHKVRILLVEWLRPPRLVLTLFLCLMAACGAALVWLGWKAVEQDRLVEAQRLQERLEGAADRIVAALDRSVRQVGDFAGSPQIQPGQALVVVSASSVEIQPRGGLAFSPWQPAGQTARSDIFQEGETLEFLRPDLEKAAAIYRRLAESGTASVRAGALVRMGRILRRERRWTEALHVYDELAKMESVGVEGTPAALIAHAARCSTFEESGQRQRLQEAAQIFWSELSGGRWMISRPALDTYTDEARRWLGTLPSSAEWNERLALANAADLAWQGRLNGDGRWFGVLDGAPVSACWWSRDGVWQARLAGSSFWIGLWTSLGRDSSARLYVTGERGEVFFGTRPARPAVFRASTATGLPWNIGVGSAAEQAPPVAWALRRRWMAAGFAVFVLLLAAGSYFIARSMLRELAVARLQADFVSAVSHEFRTPLTSIRHLSEMLALDRVDTAEQAHKAYNLMMAESDRLGRLVESLLDFGRMQSGAFRFRFESLDAGEWARDVVQRFEDTVRGKGYSVEFSNSANGARLRADREALGNALWNVLDNAVKYSPDRKRVEVEVVPGAGTVELRVRDHGIGIRPEDSRRVFDRFYRGGSASKTGAKGVGIGLAIVRVIVRAHGGEVTVQSSPETGTVFTIDLPREEGS